MMQEVLEFWDGARPGAAHPQAAVDPLPDPDRSGPSTAIVMNGTAYIVDFGPEQGQGAALTSGRED